MGAHTYLTQFNEGDQKSELVEKLLSQIQSVYDSHITEYKLSLKFTPNQLQQQLRDKKKQLLQNVLQTNIIVGLCHKTNKYSDVKQFFTYLQSKAAEPDYIIPRLEKVNNQFSSNEEDIDELIF